MAVSLKTLWVVRLMLQLSIIINEIAHHLNIQTIAEYVENTEIVKVISAMGIDYMQGNALGYPIPLDQILPK
ncbi:MAG: hypothetical protein A3E87_07545 [Gammaproteobacteria bacterium RIFCSPHIGHO2_12_FULL_35_23]|nr:MAG: hypothetical protein A3E87_07545 [Gammaproteobacteria bacterium RIFCSPHIGHO2_12_FULL_35_23]